MSIAKCMLLARQKTDSPGHLFLPLVTKTLMDVHRGSKNYFVF